MVNSMNALNNINGIQDIKVLQEQRQANAPRELKQGKPETTDQAEFSTTALRLAGAELTPTAIDRIGLIRESIRLGKYETAGRLDVTIDRLQADLNPLDVNA